VRGGNLLENWVDVGRPEMKDLLQCRSKIGKEYQYSHPSTSTPAVVRTSTPEYQYSCICAYYYSRVPVLSHSCVICPTSISKQKNKPSRKPSSKPIKQMDLDAELPNNLLPQKTRVAYSEPKQDAELPSKNTDLTNTQTCGLHHDKKSEPESVSRAANCCN
jgi:hypothetical protein